MAVFEDQFINEICLHVGGERYVTAQRRFVWRTKSIELVNLSSDKSLSVAAQNGSSVAAEDYPRNLTPAFLRGVTLLCRVQL
jgi:hypothetical protein